MRKIIKLLEDMIGIKIKLHFYSPPHVGAIRDGAFTWTGHVKEIDYDSIDGGCLIFHHDSIDAKRMQLDTSYLNLSAAVIWSIDVISEDYKDDKAFIECPSCEQVFSIEEVDIMGENDLEEIEEKIEEEPKEESESKDEE